MAEQETVKKETMEVVKYDWLRKKLTKYGKLVDFLENAKVKVMIYEPHPMLGHINALMEINSKTNSPHAMGMYEHRCDIIFVNKWLMEQKQRTMVRVICHELGHWTGHKTRINRKDLIRRTGTEEVIAESCFFYLSKHFKIDQKWAIESSTKYIKTFREQYPKMDEALGYKEGAKAAQYLLDLMNNKNNTENNNKGEN